MPVARFQMPDGRIARFQVPEGTTPEQAQAMIAASLGDLIPPAEPSFMDQAKQTAGNVLAGAVRGAGSIGATILSPWDKVQDWAAGDRKNGPSRNDERRKAMDDALASFGAQPDSLAYRGGKVGAEIAGTLGVGGAAANGLRAVAPALSSAPAVANVLRAVETAGLAGGNLASRTAGAGVNGLLSAGLVDPNDAAAGGLIGAATPSVIGGFTKAGSAAAGLLRPAAGQPATLADKAVNQFGIPLGVGDLSRSNATRALRSVLNDTPLVGKIGERQQEAVQEGFNAAVGSTFGAKAPKLTPEVMDAAKKRLGAEFDRIWNNNALVVDAPMFQKLQEMQTLAEKLPANEGGAIKRELQDLFSKMQSDNSGALVVPGEVANRFQSYLRRRAESGGGIKNELNDLRQTIIGAFNRSVAPSDAAALTANRAAYKAFKTVEPLMNSAEVGVAGRIGGDVPAGLLPGAVLRSYGNAAGTPLGDLAQIGSQFVADRVPRTGGSARAMIQNSAIAGALGAGAFTNPGLAAVATPIAAAVEYGLGAPWLGRVMATPPSGAPGLLAAPVARALPVAAQPLGLLGAL